MNHQRSKSRYKREDQSLSPGALKTKKPGRGGEAEKEAKTHDRKRMGGRGLFKLSPRFPSDWTNLGFLNQSL